MYKQHVLNYMYKQHVLNNLKGTDMRGIINILA